MKILKLNFFTLFVCLYKPQEFFVLFCKVQADGSVIGCKASKSSCKARKLTLAKRIGFSLIELMISLITISIIAAAFTPVITKKLSASSITVGSMGGGGITEFVPDCSAWGDDCTLCTSKSCALCVKVCASNEYVNTKDCSCVACASVHDANCSECTKDSCTSCKDGYYLNNNVCSTCASKYGTTCATCNTNECLSCATNYILSDSPTSNEACIPKFTCPTNGYFIEITYNAGTTKEYKLCVPKYNMGDIPGMTEQIPSTVTKKIASSSNSSLSYCDATTLKCCWYGSTGSPCDAGNGGYSGCSRTVCDWNAAVEICDKFGLNNGKWRLPTNDETVYFISYTKGWGTSGLMLCDYYSGYSSARCAYVQYCWGVGYCYPNSIWTSVENASKTGADNYTLRKGNWEGPENNAKAAPIGVRCVVGYDSNGNFI